MATIKLIDEFQFDETKKLGSGQFGTVYHGVNCNTNESVAIKVVQKQTLTNNYLYQLLLNEVEALSKLNSPHIIRMIALKETPNNIYIITEFCDGGDLESHLSKRKTRMKEPEVIDFLDQICEAFKEMKKDKIIHRDLKPANVLIHQGKLKLADLGFSKKVQNFQHSMNSSSVGSPIYMAPQLLLKQTYTSKCDVWSLGIITYQLLYARAPWNALDMQTLAEVIVTQPLFFPPEVPVSVELMEVISKCLRVQEFERFSWDDLINHPILQRRHIKTIPAPPLAALPINVNFNSQINNNNQMPLGSPTLNSNNNNQVPFGSPTLNNQPIPMTIPMNSNIPMNNNNVPPLNLPPLLNYNNNNTITGNMTNQMGNSPPMQIPPMNANNNNNNNININNYNNSNMTTPSLNVQIPTTPLTTTATVSTQASPMDTPPFTSMDNRPTEDLPQQLVKKVLEVTKQHAAPIKKIEDGGRVGKFAAANISPREKINGLIHRQQGKTPDVKKLADLSRPKIVNPTTPTLGPTHLVMPIGGRPDILAAYGHHRHPAMTPHGGPMMYKMH